MYDFWLDVNDATQEYHVGFQWIVTPERHVAEYLQKRVAYMGMPSPTDGELARIPQALIFTSNMPWDPSKLGDK